LFACQFHNNFCHGHSVGGVHNFELAIDDHAKPAVRQLLNVPRVGVSVETSVVEYLVVVHLQHHLQVFSGLPRHVREMHDFY